MTRGANGEKEDIWSGGGDHFPFVASLTTGGHAYPFRVPCRFEGRAGFVVIDQIRTVDRERLARRLGKLSPSTLGRILAILQEMFTP